MYRTVQAALGCAYGLLFLAQAGYGQSLDQAGWYERVTLQMCDQLQEMLGLSLDSPDDLEDSLTVGGWVASGHVTYEPPGAPQFTAHAFGKHLDDCPDIMSEAIAESRTVVTFQFAIRKILAPPVSVSEVPCFIVAHGSTFITGTMTPDHFVNGDPAGFAQLLITSEGVTLVDRTITAAGQRHGLSLNFSESHDIPLDTVVSGSVEAFGQVRMSRLNVGQWAEATATIVPDFQISTDIIPGTMSKYSDYFQIEYSPGYWALGNPTPVQTSTWGNMKSRYLHR